MDIKTKVSQIAKEKGLSVSKVEKDCGLARSSIDKWASHYPSIEKVKKVADYLDTTIDFLCSEDSENDVMSPYETQLIRLFRELDAIGQRLALDQLDTLVASKKYNLTGQYSAVSREVV